MIFIWLVLSILCLLYYIVCVNYAGFGSAFVVVWFVTSILFLSIFIISLIIKYNQINVPQWLSISFFGVLVFGVVLFIFLESLIISKINSVPEKNCEYIIILGAQIKGNRVSNALKQRLDAAYDYIIDNPSTKIIVSGGKGLGEDVTEA
ncbi:MAG: YdcF family protein, partial [Bacteroidales bacterium]